MKKWWKSLDADSFLGFGAFIVIVAMFAGLISSSCSESKRDRECGVVCDIKVHKVIEDTCYCKSTTGWDKVK